MIINTPISLGELIDKISILRIKKKNIEDIEKQYRVAEIELTGVMIPGIATDKGDHSLAIVEILKRI